MKVPLAVAGWNFGSGNIFDMMGNEQLWKEFVQQATQLIRDHRFDGLNLHCVWIIKQNQVIFFYY